MAWIAAIGGGAWFSSDDWRNEDTSRFSWAFDEDRFNVGRAGKARATRPNPGKSTPAFSIM